ARHFPGWNRFVGLVFMYMMFQVLALLWAFLLNAYSSVTLDISGLAAQHSFNFAALNLSHIGAFATFYCGYSTFRVFAHFGSAIASMAWESLDDFPHICRVSEAASAQWPYMISVIFLPQFFLAASLVFTPYLCAGLEEDQGGSAPFSLDLAG
ncbi:unnamed protein product, partial [Chrysoparadoxa australica]